MLLVVAAEGMTGPHPDCQKIECGIDTLPAVKRSNSEPGDAKVSYADGFPFLLLSEGSLEDLNRRLDEPLGIERFRPNIVEGGWSRTSARLPAFRESSFTRSPMVSVECPPSS